MFSHCHQYHQLNLSVNAHLTFITLSLLPLSLVPLHIVAFKLPFILPQLFCLYCLSICLPPMAIATKHMLFLMFAPCANLLCSSRQDLGPCSGPGPTGDAVVTCYRIFLLIFCMFHPFSFVLDHLLPLFSCSSYILPIGQQTSPFFRLCGSCSALETHSFPASKLNTKCLHMIPCNV